MNKKQASELIQKTFPAAFDRDRFRNFSLNVLNRLDESKAQQWSAQVVKDAFKKHVHHYERLGTYISPEKETVDVLIVFLTAESKLERARTAIRNFVADHLKARDEKDAALVAFVSPTEKQWRFSYIKMDYATVAKEPGKVGVETRLTPARRFSYLVGEGESCHTAQTRFLDLLQDTATDPTLSQIEEAFSVDAVTKEFFIKYTELFAGINASLEKLVARDKMLRDEFNAKGVNTVDFAKKLMGQIVFLYFLQKKGWLGVEKGKSWGTGPRNFLRKLANGDYGNYGNFFNDILEPLFYDTLANDRGHEAWCDCFECRIPFLNGGLFEALGDYNWKKIDVILPNKLFINNDFIEEGITGTGVLDVFDRYNFTVNEAEPLEKEVAIDPEMLGMVFENLIEENRRKGLGSYYTPREIVHYMCQESIIGYLDAALNTEKETVPLGDIGIFVRLGEQISHYEAVDTKYVIKMPKCIQTHARSIDNKLAEITICDPAVGSGAFPVGMMHEIVHARVALTPYFNDVHERTPYHFKRSAIQNSLYGVDIDTSAVAIAKLRLWLSLVVEEEDDKQIKPLPNLDYKILVGNSLIGFPFKSIQLQEIEELKKLFFNTTDYKEKEKLKSNIDHILYEIFKRSKSSLGYEVNFDFQIFFSEVFHKKRGFDVIIANPPYVDSEEMCRNQEDFRKLCCSLFSSARGNWDLFIIFIERGLSILCPKGIISYIVPNKLIGASYSEALREMLMGQAIQQIRDYSSVRVFRNVDVYPVVFMIQKVGLKRDVRMEVMQDLEIPSYLNVIPARTFYSDIHWGRYFQKHETLDILNKYSTFSTLKQIIPDISGAATVSEAYELIELIHEYKYNEKKSYKKLINTGTINRYSALWSIRPTRYIKKSYQAPIVYDEDLNKLNRIRLRQSQSSKIIIGGMTKVIECMYDEGEYLAGKSTVIVLSSNALKLKYIVAILNSSFVSFWFRAFYNSLCLAGGYLRIGRKEIGTIPIPKVTKQKETQIASLVDNILTAKKMDSEADTTRLEREIDCHVYELYGLTKKEIAYIEDSRNE
jgi:hypothetical protein